MGCTMGLSDDGKELKFRLIQPDHAGPPTVAGFTHSQKSLLSM